MNTSAGTTVGQVARFGNDSIRSWVTTDASGAPISIGVTFSEAAFNTLPKTDTSLTLMFPMTMGMGMMTATPFDHVDIDWVPEGDPEPPYDSAHLDCHFDMTSMQDMMGFHAGRDSMGMDPKYMPGGYMCDSMVEEMMGVHWMDTTATEFHGGRFQHTMVFGSYHGTMAFLEPMCAGSFLKTKPNASFDVRQPSQYQRSGYFPTKYSVKYDATAKTYTISLDGLSKH
ncbi:MAG: DUF5602 domain-containing protein [Bacteroidetes bacterium]|nr:DUF5602 domain-containing protein [Bacteroidota bacterium]